MTAMSNYLESELLDHSLGTAWTAPTNVYALLHTADPTDTCTVAVATNNTKSAAISFGAASGGVAATTADITWTNVSTTENYHSISLWDANTAGATGNPLYYGPLTGGPISVTAGDDFTIASGDLTITLT